MILLTKDEIVGLTYGTSFDGYSGNPVLHNLLCAQLNKVYSWFEDRGESVDSNRFKIFTLLMDEWQAILKEIE